jgi:hypothetical protein
MQHIMNALTDKPGWETKVRAVFSKSYLEAIPCRVGNDVCPLRWLSHDGYSHKWSHEHSLIRQIISRPALFVTDRVDSI